MRIMQRRWSVALALAALAAAGCRQDAAQASRDDAPKPLVVGTDAAFPPMEFTQDDGSIAGFDADLVEAIGRELDRPVDLRNIAWSGMFGALKNGTLDLVASSVTITPERQQAFLFSEAYMEAGQALIVRVGDRERFPDLDSLAGHRIGAQAGTTGHLRLEQEQGLGEIVAYDSSPLAMIDLVNGSIDAVMIDKPVADYYAARKPELAGKLAVVGDMYTEERFGLVARKDEQALMADINRALARIRESGEYDRIHEKWFGPAAKPAAAAQP